MAEYMEKKPNGILRLIQYGEKDKVLSHQDIWYCVSCKKCGVRCPNDIDMSAVFDTLREMSIEAGLAYHSEMRIPIIHEEFVRTLAMFGRLHEAFFFVMYMARSLDLFSNLPSGLQLFMRGKLPILPTQIHDIVAFRRMFQQTYRRNTIEGRILSWLYGSSAINTPTLSAPTKPASLGRTWT